MKPRLAAVNDVFRNPPDMPTFPIIGRAARWLRQLANAFRQPRIIGACRLVM